MNKICRRWGIDEARDVTVTRAVSGAASRRDSLPSGRDGSAVEVGKAASGGGAALSIKGGLGITYILALHR